MSGIRSSGSIPLIAMEFLHSSEFASHVEDLMSQHHVPGLAIAIVRNDEIDSIGFGKASLEPPEPCTADTLFDIGSSAKSLTAAAVALLVNDDENYPEVQYDAIVSSLLPGDFVMPSKSYTEGVTVEDLLSHRTGMPG
jgi:CubicO group peptidase (beta-lactamase class C family)